MKSACFHTAPESHPADDALDIVMAEDGVNRPNDLFGDAGRSSATSPLRSWPASSELVGAALVLGLGRSTLGGPALLGGDVDRRGRDVPGGVVGLGGDGVDRAAGGGHLPRTAVGRGGVGADQRLVHPE